MRKKIKVSSAGLVCVAGGISVWKCCIVLVAEPREEWVFMSISGFPLAASSPRVAAPPPKKYPGQKNPASYAGWCRSNSGVTLRLKLVCAHDGDM